MHLTPSELTLSPQYQAFTEQLSQALKPSQIIIDAPNRLAYGTDASFYRQIPQVVLRLDTISQVQLVVRLAAQYQLPYTFRAAGTSLSGQAVSDSILITLSDQWREANVFDDGKLITLQPGVIGADANRLLMPFQRKIGPDPASINTCKIGGIAANNASGMCCGTAQNSYHTLTNLTVVLHDGTLVNTASEESLAAFRSSHHTLLAGLSALRETILSTPNLKQKIAHKYRLKNTTGYALNAFIDFDDPIEIFKHLMIGSEGTLGFIAQISYRTVEDPAHKAAALLIFDNIESACNAVTMLSKTPVAAVELMDGRALKSVAHESGMPSFMPTLSLEAAGLLIETQANDQTQLNLQCKSVMDSLAAFHIAHQVAFTKDPQTIGRLWGIRKGMFPAVGAVRQSGTTVIIEDIAFPLAALAAGVRDLQQLFEKHHYHEAIIFGHALAGNLHFVFTQGFENKNEIQRYAEFMQEVTELVAVKYQGSLKAEHGTGRNMAPFVELEWGHDAYQIMQAVKTLFDPQNLLNPGVIINQDPKAHLKHLKPMPKADPLVDRCIECGFCEPVCPSRTLSLSPRQRIVLYRELSYLKQTEQTSHFLKKAFDYQGIDTCAATGLCAERCPVGINTGDLIKQLRQKKYASYRSIARWSADHFATVTKLAKIGLRSNQAVTKTLGEKRVKTLITGIRKLTQNTTPTWLAQYPNPNRHVLNSFTTLDNEDRKVVYVPSCSSRVMGAASQDTDRRSLTEVTLSLLKKAHFDVIIPHQCEQLCCGMPFESKGMSDIADTKLAQLETALWKASDQGNIPILFDTSPCIQRALASFSRSMRLYEPSQFVIDCVIQHLNITPQNEPVMLHITCSSQRMGRSASLIDLAKRCAREVIIPDNIHCCGWAGDKGFTTPELNQAALSGLKSQVPENCSQGYSNSRTCEIGLSHHSGISYQSILYLVDNVSRAI
ncbi:FAD-binding and (Fe-S)-binding domain-containing protein [Vibrio agarilyticus]|uniref:FAD-binding and (Fe-S)-binding domain-containing protein n=1 Tax=Vibrio agarilyticus TaxID=2726741 RepID=UPI001FEC58E2|nr:FAD-binding and (Fe-S)-binding domain-containing protein [Vibrio agarilyticus]